MNVNNSSQPRLPVLHTEGYPHIIMGEDQMNKVLYASTVTNGQRNFYFDSNGDWYEGKFTKILGRTNLLKRLLGFFDIITVDMKFHKMEEPAMTEKQFLRYLMEATTTISFRDNTGYPRGSKDYVKLVRSEFRKCETASDILQWLIKYKITMKSWDTY